MVLVDDSLSLDYLAPEAQVPLLRHQQSQASITSCVMQIILLFLKKIFIYLF